MTDSDASLVARVRAGDSGAAGVLLRRHFRTSYLVALSATADSAMAEDACQDAFVRALEKIDTCRAPDHFGAWLMSIVRRVAHNHRRSHGRRRGDPLDDHSALASDLRTSVGAKRLELRERLASAIGHLTVGQREVLLLHDLEGLRHRDIAAQLGCTEEMSRRHLSDARRRMRDLLGNYATLSPDHD